MANDNPSPVARRRVQVLQATRSGLSWRLTMSCGHVHEVSHGPDVLSDRPCRQCDFINPQKGLEV